MSKSKIVVISDLHPDVVTLGVSRFVEVERAVHEAKTHAIEEKADVFLFLGDLCDPDSGGDTFKAIAMMVEVSVELTDHDIQVVLVRGNHDVNEDGTGTSTLTPLAALEKGRALKELLYVAEEPRLIYVREDLAILCLPFMPTSHGIDIAEATAALWPEDGTKVIVASHLSVPGIIPGEETTELPRGREIAYPFKETTRAIARLQGHYHRRQTFDPGDGGPPLIVPGSIARLTFGEEDHTPSFLVVEA